ncbi:hypothetical protein ACFZB5_33795 [Streptomyces nodosus]|uniref:hypothetical protein n=1 Tax=Streptomyces nodosus TaxID=40318 RepID=UPI0036E6A0EB
MITLPALAGQPRRSVFAGADIAATARLSWLDGHPRPRFEDDVWSLAGWADAPVQMSSAEKTWPFDRILHSGWRLVAKELALAWVASQDERVLAVPQARRVPRHPRTVQAWLYHLTFWLNWLAERRVSTLAAVTQDHCEAFLREYGVVRDKETGAVLRNKAGSSLRSVVEGMQDITDYGELLSADRHRPGFRPWGDRSPAQVTGAPTRPHIVIKTAPLDDTVLGPLLTACLHLVDVLGPHIVDLRAALRAERLARQQTEWNRNLKDAGLFASLVDGYLRAAEPLPKIETWQVAKRLRRGWDRQDPLLDLDFQHLLRPIGHRDVGKGLLARARPMLEEAVAEVGTEYVRCRNGVGVPRADTGQMVPWSPPLSHIPADSLVRVAGHACVVATSALTGMRSSESMELVVGCRRTDRDDDTARPATASWERSSRARRWGGEPDEWVVIDEVARVFALAEQLTDAGPGQLLFGQFNGFESNGPMTWLRKWVASPAGQRPGPEPIPEVAVHPRRLRRTLSVEMAARPGGLFATKVHFKHLSVATSEGYAGRPEGAQAGFHHEWKRAEAKEKLNRTVESFHQYQQGQLPAGPGADALLATFRTIENELEGHDPGPVKVVTVRQVELLLKRKASVLHLSTANYCWFEDPAKALCLKLAGAKIAAAPLTGLCDSSRCPQATHHLIHRPVWQTAATNGADLLASPRVPAGEKSRLRAELDRSKRILEEIDRAAGKAE